MTELLDTYTPAALATAQPRARDLEYLRPGIIGEVGEFFAEFAKAHWHESDRSATMVDEYGDIAWLTAVLLDKYDLEGTMVQALVRPRTMHTVEGALQMLLGHATAVYRSEENDLPMRAANLWCTLANHAELLAGAPWQQVLDRNTEKLAARAKAGELKSHA